MAGKIKLNRLPFQFFETKGKGESDLEIHAGSYHMALHQAKISDYNIISYSSVLPKTAERIDIKDSPEIPFGSELFTIMATAHGRRNETTSAGIVYGQMYEKGGGKKIGGLVCEIGGNYKEEDLKIKLEQSIKELHEKTYSQYELKELKYITDSFVPRLKYGTVLIALCFVNFLEINN